MSQIFGIFPTRRPKGSKGGGTFLVGLGIETDEEAWGDPEGRPFVDFIRGEGRSVDQALSAARARAAEDLPGRPEAGPGHVSVRYVEGSERWTWLPGRVYPFAKDRPGWSRA